MAPKLSKENLALTLVECEDADSFSGDAVVDQIRDETNDHLSLLIIELALVTIRVLGPDMVEKPTILTTHPRD